MHATHLVPGKWLDFSEDAHGLNAEGRLSKTALGNELSTLIDDGAIDALSIGYAARGSRYDKRRQSHPYGHRAA